MGIFKNAKRRAIMALTLQAKSESPIEMPVPTPSQVSVEQSMFKKANNLMDGNWEAAKVTTSNFSAHERYVWPIEKPYKGFVILAENEEDFREKAARVDKGDTVGFYTIFSFMKRYGVIDEELEKFENDIEFLVQVELQETDYNVGEKTLKMSGEDFQPLNELPVEGPVMDLVMSDINMAFINREEGSPNNFVDFKREYLEKHPDLTFDDVEEAEIIVDTKLLDNGSTN